MATFETVVALIGFSAVIFILFGITVLVVCDGLDEWRAKRGRKVR